MCLNLIASTGFMHMDSHSSTHMQSTVTSLSYSNQWKTECRDRQHLGKVQNTHTL